MPRVRTIKGVVEYFKQLDPQTQITEHFVRQLVWQNKIKFHKAGAKYLVNLDEIENYFKNPPDVIEPDIEIGKIRRVM